MQMKCNVWIPIRSNVSTHDERNNNKQKAKSEIKKEHTLTRLHVY